MERLKEVKTWGNRAYLSRKGKQILSDSARRIAINEPGHVDDPSDPTTAECLVEIQSRNDVDIVDDALVQRLLANQLTYEEVVLWLLHRYAGLETADLAVADVHGTDIQSPAVECSLQRTVERILASAERKLRE
jgi:hypothetical protein